MTTNLEHVIKKAPCGEAIELVGFVAKEGLGISHNATILECQMTMAELVDQIELEKNSSEMNEWDKTQRDVKSIRVKGLKDYATTREDTFFPGMILFVAEAEELELRTYGGRDLMKIRILPEADRHMADGQGRVALANALRKKKKYRNFDSHTFNVKVIIPHTATLLECKEMMRQVFADLHVNVKKPNASINLLFNAKDPVNSLIQGVMDIDLPFDDSLKLKDLIAGHGNLGVGKIWKYRQLADSLRYLFKSDKKELHASLADDQSFLKMLDIAKNFFIKLLSSLPISELLQQSDIHSWKKYWDKSLYTKSTFLYGAALVGRSLIEQADREGRDVAWEQLEDLIELPTNTMDDELWIDNKICIRTSSETIKLIKGSQKEIGTVICNKLNIYPCASLLGIK